MAEATARPSSPSHQGGRVARRANDPGSLAGSGDGRWPSVAAGPRQVITITPRMARSLQRGLVLAVVASLTLAYLLSPTIRAEVASVGGLVARGDAAAIGERPRSYGPWAPAVSLGLMIGQALVAPIPVFLIVFANGLAFGVG